MSRRSRQLARRVAFGAMHLGGVDAVARRMARDRLLIMCYHGVGRSARAGEHALIVHEREFTRQMQFLAEAFRILPLEDALAFGSVAVDQRPTACITFDDGYRNVHDVAYPILRRLGIPATVFLATGFIGQQRRLWTTEMELSIEQAPSMTLDLAVLGLGQARLESAASRRETAFSINRELKRLNSEDRAARLAVIAGQLPVPACDPDDDFAFMTWADVRAMAATGDIGFGAHTVNHEILGRVESVVRAREIRDSVASVRLELQAQSPQAVSSVFAYPNGEVGDFNAACADALREVGCSAALTTQESLASAVDNRFALPRVVVGGPMHFAEFVVRVSGAPAYWRKP